MNSILKCPFCGAKGKIYGLPYGLQIGSSIKGKNLDVYETILIHCEACGAVLGGYEKKQLAIKE